MERYVRVAERTCATGITLQAQTECSICNIHMSQRNPTLDIITLILFTEVTGHNPPPRSESPVQWQGRIKPTESQIADLKAKFQELQT